MNAGIRWAWALIGAWIDLLRTTGRLMQTRYGFVFAAIAILIVIVQVVPR